MRMIFGVLGLVVVLAIVGVLAKKQLQPPVSRPIPSGTDTSAPSVAVTPALPKQVGASVEAVMQQPRALPDGQ